LLVLEGKASFSKEFRCEFQNVNAAVERAMSGFEGGQKKVMSLKKIRKKKKSALILAACEWRAANVVKEWKGSDGDN